MGEFVVEVAHSANLVVLRTPPGQRARGRVGARPAGAARRARHRRRRRHDARGRAPKPSAAPPSPPSSPPSPVSREERNDRDAEASGARVFGRARHVGRGAVDPRGVGRRGRRVRGRRRPADSRRRLGRDPRARASRPARSRSRSSTRAREFADDFLVPALHANALYEGKYPLVSALSRPVIVEHLVASARRHGADAVGHGCTGKGNDQVRFEVSSRILAPDLDVLAPVRVWGFTRADCIELAAKWDIPIEATKEKLYSIDENMWGRAIECGVLENPWVVAARGAVHAHAQRRRTRRASRARSSSASSRACPVALDGERDAGLVELIDDARRRRSARTAGAASTWSRTGGSASRAARSTSARRRSR